MSFFVLCTSMYIATQFKQAARYNYGMQSYNKKQNTSQ